MSPHRYLPPHTLVHTCSLLSLVHTPSSLWIFLSAVMNAPTKPMTVGSITQPHKKQLHGIKLRCVPLPLSVSPCSALSPCCTRRFTCFFNLG